MTDNADLIDLQHAHAFQLTRSGVRGPWRVRQNITSEHLADLPAELTERQVFAVLDFARRFELEAFNVGIAHGKRLAGEIHDPTLTDMQRRLQTVRDENEKICTHLDRLTRGV